MKIANNIEFNPGLRLQEQSQEFQAWLLDNCLSRIDDKYPVAYFDGFERPTRYDFDVDSFHVALFPIYLLKERSSWAISGYEININTVE